MRQLDDGNFIIDTELPSSTWLQESVYSEDQPRVMAVVNEAVRSKTIFEMEHRVRRLDGTLGWTFSRAVPLLNAQGELVEWFGVASDVTERRRADEALRESEERYRNLFNSMDEGYCIIEMIFDEHEKPVDYRFLEVNPSFEQQCGLHNATGKRIREFYPNLEEYWFELYGKVALTGEPVRYVNEAKTMEGRWFDVYAFRVGGPDSRKIAVLFNDVKQRKEAEAALRESEERYRNLFNSIDEGFCVIEMIFDEHEQPIDYRFLEVNPTFERQTGLRDAIGKRMRELRPNLEAHWFEIYGQVALTGETIRFVQEAKSMEGRWFDVYASRVGEPESRKVAIVFDDITERRQSEEALRQMERSLRFIMDSMPQKIFTATPDGDIDYFNPQWTEFTGMSFEQMQDSGWTRFVHPDDLDEKAQHWRHAFDTGEPFQSEHRFRRADGEYRWHISRALPMRDETGRITMWVGSNTDVHDMKQAEATLRRQAVQLSELHHRKDEFLAMLSHELRSPLAPIANAVQLLGLQKSGESRIQQQARGIIERQVGQLQHLVDDLLEVSRITTGRVQLRLERVDMCRIAEGAVETVRPLIEQRRHELTVTLPQESVWMMADAARLEQVLINLLTNASKYTEGGGHIWLTVSVEERGTRVEEFESSGISLAPHSSLLATPHVVIRVRDTGVGISPALLPHVFDLFTQADRSLDRSQGGLGIGLALVQRLTELHGGQVEAFSTIGEGSEFVVRLPVQSEELRVTSGESQHSSSLTTHHSPLATPLKVLVVDDNVDTVLGFSMLLKASGHDVRTAHDGLSAVEVAIDYRPDVVLLDIGLPGLNGYEVAKRLRQHSELKHTVLIALTGYGQDTDRQTSQQAGFNHHLVKPARFEQLNKILTTVQEGLKV
ncbi:MAG: PAS domain S-box protein [Fuerstia sp.]|nr:PAS domain S-box protein [Fuerstiella sp.]